jgi:aerobic-type carbon monoxide dehydrogenase small subunit (CoxS/CutS family)
MSETTAAVPNTVPVSVEVNGVRYQRTTEPRMLLSDFLRHELGLTGTHVGCEHGVCGACTVLVDGEAVRACLMFAVQVNGREVRTVEGLGTPEDLHPIQEAFHEAHGAQCGFCTPGILLSVVPFLAENPDPSEAEIREALAGNLCRCTGYQNIVKAIGIAASKLRNDAGETA